MIWREDAGMARYLTEYMWEECQTSTCVSIFHNFSIPTYTTKKKYNRDTP